MRPAIGVVVIVLLQWVALVLVGFVRPAEVSAPSRSVGSESVGSESAGSEFSGSPVDGSSEKDERAKEGSSKPSRPAHHRSSPPWEGMTISCPMDGREWGTDAMVTTLEKLKALGVEWVAIHPYAGVGEDGSLRFGSFDPAPSYITRPIREAHKLGLKIAIKPHLAYWGTRFSWRGEIAFESDAQWRRFFDDYQTWIVGLAEVSKDADLFVLGTELDKTLGHTEQWGRIVRGVKRKYSGPTTYAANWTDYTRVTFWDQLDYIGVQGYFPLVAEGEPATRDAIRAGWQRVAGSLAEYSAVLGRPVLFTELGYNLSSMAAHKPWDYRTGGESAERIQRECMEAALEALEAYPQFAGAFLWKYFPAGFRAPRNFSMQSKAMQELIARYWRRTSTESAPSKPGVPKRTTPPPASAPKNATSTPAGG